MGLQRDLFRIDARKVETGILLVINTGIANKQAGRGQIGAGTVTPPMDCFEKLSWLQKIRI